jgi:hypothetical protein
LDLDGAGPNPLLPGDGAWNRVDGIDLFSTPVDLSARDVPVSVERFFNDNQMTARVKSGTFYVAPSSGR